MDPYKYGQFIGGAGCSGRINIQEQTIFVPKNERDIGYCRIRLRARWTKAVAEVAVRLVAGSFGAVQRFAPVGGAA